MRSTGPTLAATRASASLTIAAAVAAALLAACGSTSKPPGAGAGATSHGAFTLANAERYPDCMRGHGVTNFPDPVVVGHTVKIRIDPSITGSPAYASAQQACAYVVPAAVGPDDGLSAAQRQARRAGVLAFAACVRQHGFPSFPDPTKQGQLTPEMIRAAGITLEQPAVRQVGDACVAASRGQITKADVARAIADAGASGSP